MSNSKLVQDALKVYETHFLAQSAAMLSMQVDVTGRTLKAGEEDATPQDRLKALRTLGQAVETVADKYKTLIQAANSVDNILKKEDRKKNDN